MLPTETSRNQTMFNRTVGCQRDRRSYLIQEPTLTYKCKNTKMFMNVNHKRHRIKLLFHCFYLQFNWAQPFPFVKYPVPVLGCLAPEDFNNSPFLAGPPLKKVNRWISESVKKGLIEMKNDEAKSGNFQIKLWLLHMSCFTSKLIILQ